MHDHNHDHDHDHEHHDHEHHDHDHSPLPQYEMQVKVEDLSPVKKKIRVSVPKEEVQREYESNLNSVKKMAQVPGFRPGKAPRQLLEKQYADALQKGMIENLIKGTFERALTQSNLIPLTQPEISEIDFKPDQDFNYEATFETRPEFEIGEYRGLKLKKEPVKVEDKQIDEQLERLRDMQGVLKPRLAGASVAKDDFVTIDLQGRINGSEDARLKAENQTFQVGANMIYPEVDKALLEKKEGDSFSVKLTLSDKIKEKDLAGKAAEVQVTLRAIKQRSLPELNDAFAASLGGKVKTLLELRQQVRSELEVAAKQATEEKLREDALDQLANAHTFTMPESLVQQEALQLMQRTARRMASDGIQPDKDFFAKEEAQEQFKQAAEANLRRDLILDKIASKESIAVTEEEVEKYLTDTAASAGLKLEELQKAYKKGEAREELKFRIRAQKTLDFILGQAKVN